MFIDINNFQFRKANFLQKVFNLEAFDVERINSNWDCRKNLIFNYSIFESPTQSKFKIWELENDKPLEFYLFK